MGQASVRDVTLEKAFTITHIAYQRGGSAVGLIDRAKCLTEER